MKSVYTAEDPIRYQYLIEKVVEFGEIWLLQAREGLFAMMEDSTGQEYLPVWPEKEFAALFSSDDWDGYQPEPMPLFEFNSWLKELEEDEIKIAAFPNRPESIIPLHASEIKFHLETEYKRQHPK